MPPLACLLNGLKFSLEKPPAPVHIFQECEWSKRIWACGSIEGSRNWARDAIYPRKTVENTKNQMDFNPILWMTRGQNVTHLFHAQGWNSSSVWSYSAAERQKHFNVNKIKWKPFSRQVPFKCKSRRAESFLFVMSCFHGVSRGHPCTDTSMGARFVLEEVNRAEEGQLMLAVAFFLWKSPAG